VVIGEDVDYASGIRDDRPQYRALFEVARAKAQGKRISRPPITAAVQAHIAEFYARGLPIHQISKQVQVSYGC
jgi:hypothetical protein